MRLRITGRRLVFAVIIAVAASFIGLEAFLLSAHVRQFAVGGAERVGADGLLASLASDKDVEVRESARQAIVRRGDKPVPLLVERLNDPDVETRLVASYLLGRVGEPARSSLPALKERLWNDQDLPVRAAATQALSAIAKLDPETSAEFVRLLAEGDKDGRVLAARVLKNYGFQPAVVPALALALRDPVPIVRQESADALEQIGPSAKQSVPALVQAASDPDSGVRKEVAEALQRISYGLGEQDAPLRDSARKALEQMMIDEAKAPQP
jgi:HEAT repeat protein